MHEQRPNLPTFNVQLGEGPGGVIPCRYDPDTKTIYAEGEFENDGGVVTTKDIPINAESPEEVSQMIWQASAGHRDRIDHAHAQANNPPEGEHAPEGGMQNESIPAEVTNPADFEEFDELDREEQVMQDTPPVPRPREQHAPPPPQHHPDEPLYTQDAIDREALLMKQSDLIRLQHAIIESELDGKSSMKKVEAEMYKHYIEYLNEKGIVL